MKTTQPIFRFFLALPFVLFILGGKLSSAQYYTFSNEMVSYEPIVNPDIVLDDSAYINQNLGLLHFTFPTIYFTAFGKPITDVLEVGRNGYIAALGENNDFIFDPFSTTLRSDGNSKFHASEIKIGTDSVLEVEWVNFRIEDHPDTDYINMKARIYINSEIIEFYYGPSVITAVPAFPSGTFTTLLLTTKGFGTNVQSIWVKGNPQNPIVNSSPGSLTGFPQEGTMYRFTGKRIVTGVNEHQTGTLLTVYPNPALQTLQVDGPENTAGTISITDLSGKVVFEQRSNSLKQTLDLSSVESGIYLLLVIDENGQHYRNKFTKQ
jgi:hypothetical protein